MIGCMTVIGTTLSLSEVTSGSIPSIIKMVYVGVLILTSLTAVIGTLLFALLIFVEIEINELACMITWGSTTILSIIGLIMYFFI